MHKTEHSISVVVIFNPTHLSGMVGFLGTRKHVNDLAGVDQGDEGKEVNMVVHEITSRGEVVLVLDREARRAGDKGIKRSRSQSVTDEPKKEKVKKKKKKVDSESDNVEEVTESMDVGMKVDEELNEDSPDVLTLAVELDEKSVKNTKSKKKKKNKDKDSAPERIEETAEKIVDVLTIKLPTILQTDPGWDFSATSVSTPAWQSASIWSDDELDEEDEEEDAAEKSHLSKSE